MKNLKKQLMAAIAMTLVATVALGSSTYAWFVNNTLVEAGPVNVTAETSNALLISDEGQAKWGTSFPMAAIAGLKLTPVSTIGSAGGKTMDFYESKVWETETGGVQNGEYLAKEFEKIADNTTTTKLFTDKFDIKASQPCKLYLTDATDFAKNEGMLDQTLRLAIAVTNGSDTTQDKLFFYQIDDANTKGVNTTKVGLNADGLTNAIESTTTASKILADNADATNIKVYTDHLATSGGNGAFVTPNAAEELFEFAASDDICKVTVYIWMEGCDYETNITNIGDIASTTLNATLNQVTAKLGFGAGPV